MFRYITLLVALYSSIVASQEARIATWNLGGFNPIPEQNVKNIIAGLRFLDADVLVLTELNPASLAERIAQDLSETSNDCYSSELAEQSQTDMHIAFLFKCHVQVSGTALILGSNLGGRGDREAAVANVRVDEFDFLLIGVHLKSGRTRADRLERNQQLMYISGYLQATMAAGEQDVIVIGDYNMIPRNNQDNTNFETLNSVGSVRVISSEDLPIGFTRFNSRGEPGNFLDGFAFTDSYSNAREYVEGSVEVIEMHNLLGLTARNFVNQVTDHLPLLAVFDSQTDHD